MWTKRELSDNQFTNTSPREALPLKRLSKANEMHRLLQPPPAFTPKFFAKSHWQAEYLSSTAEGSSPSLD
jgi:hypothetical protein